MKIIFTRESDGQTFEFGDFDHNFVINPSTKIPSAPTVDATGYEYSGSHGGYAVAARYQRRAFDLDFTIREKPGDDNGIIKLVALARSFFQLSNQNLDAVLYSADFFTNDKNQAQFQMQHGAISAPLGATFDGREHYATGGISFIFGDPLLYYADGVGGALGGIIDFTLFPTGATPNILIGRHWLTTGVTWRAAGTRWDTTDSGVGGNQTTINFTTETPINALITIHGSVTNPTIINATDGSEFFYVGTVADGQVLTVDTLGHVLINGAAPTGTWSGILTAQNGLNSFVLQSGASNASARAEIVLRGSF